MSRTHPTCRAVSFTVLALALAAGAAAQSQLEATAGPGSAPPPAPAAYHGYALGTTYTITDRLVEYYRMLGDQSSRVDYSEYGRSYQGRPLPMVMISSEENLRRKEEIRARVQRLTGALEPLPEAELKDLLGGLPAIVWIFIVDTDEEAGVEVLQEVAHDFATREDEQAQRLRENVLLILTPLTNPDSHARYVAWHKLYDVSGASVDPNAVENRAHWGMNTDGNSFGIDVNRDFGWFVSPEMRALASAASHWRPQFWLDIHSGPDVIFLPPFPPPYHPLWGEEPVTWWNALARRASDNFGKKGWTFNSREGYEGVTHPGFGLSWGMLGPAVSGMLYETFGGRPGKTEAFVRSDGSVATMRMAMDHHALGIYSLLEVASERREELLRDAHRRVLSAVRAARTSPVRGVVLPAQGPGVDPGKVQRLVERLVLQGVEVRRVDAPFGAVARSFQALGGAQGKRVDFPAGSYLVDFEQPQARLARALLDPTLDYGQPKVLLPYPRKAPYYDVSWGNLPYIFGVPAYALAQRSTGGTPVARGELPRPPGSTAGLRRAEPAYAYVIPSGREASYRAVIRLLQEGYRVRVFKAGTRIDGKAYPAGTWALIRMRNPADLPARIKRISEETGADVVEVAGPFTDAGVTFGDEGGLAPVPKPAVAVIADWPVAQDHTFGGIRSVLEQDFDFTFSPVMLETVNERDLSGYTAVVLPHAGMDMRGGPNFEEGYKGKLNLPNLRRYVLGGGTLVVVQGASEVIAADSVLGQDVDFEGYSQYANGAILRATWASGEKPTEELVDWRPGLSQVGPPLLAAGYELPEFAAPAAYPVLLKLREGGRAEAVARYGGDAARLRLDGYLGPGEEKRLAGRPFVVVQPAGRGRVIYYADDVTFRGNWYGLNTLFLNTLVLGPLRSSR